MRVDLWDLYQFRPAYRLPEGAPRSNRLTLRQRGGPPWQVLQFSLSKQIMPNIVCGGLNVFAIVTYRWVNALPKCGQLISRCAGFAT